MKPQETVKQHFVPRTYLKHFGQAIKGQDKIYCALKSEDNPVRVRQTAVAHVCYQNNLYTLEGETLEERMAIEDYYRLTVEEEYNVLHGLLLDEHVEQVSDNVRNTILHTVATMLLRTTKHLTRSSQTMDRVLEQMFQHCKYTKQETFSFEGHSFSIKGKTLADMQREFREQSRPGRVLTQLRLALQLSEAKRDDFGILIVQLDEEAGELITSDHPVVVWSLDRHNTALNPGSSLRLPIGPKHMLCLMPGTIELLRHRIVRWNYSGKRAKMDRITANILQQHNAERWILGSEQGLQTHIKERVTLQHDLDTPTESTAGQDIIARMERLGLL